MTSISNVLQMKIEGMLKEQPLADGEFRRLEGLGSHYVSLDPSHDGVQHFFMIKVGDKPIYIYKKTE